MSQRPMDLQTELEALNAAIAAKENERKELGVQLEEARNKCQESRAANDGEAGDWEITRRVLAIDSECVAAELQELRQERTRLRSQQSVLGKRPLEEHEMQAIAANAAALMQSKHRRLRESTVVSSKDLLNVAKSLGQSARSPGSEHSFHLQPSNKTIALKLTGAELEAARANGLNVPADGTYLLGFCQLKSEKYLVQPLLTQLLNKVVSAYQYDAFDVHAKSTLMFDNQLPDNLLCRATTQKPATPIPDVVDADSEPDPGAPEEKNEYEAVEGPPEPVQIVDPLQMGIRSEKIGIIVEGKAYGKIDTAAAHEQILTYQRTFLMKHPARQHVYGMLTDLQSAYVYRMSREPTPGERSDEQSHHIVLIGKFTGTEIFQVLQRLLSGNGDLLDNAPLLVEDPSDSTLVEAKCIGRLGRGGFGRVLHITVRGKDYALKIPTQRGLLQRSMYNLAQELEMTRAVAGQCVCVPDYVASVEARGRQMVLTRPVGIPHNKCRWRKSLLVHLLESLRTLWDRQHPILIVHRDIRPSNIIYVEDGQGSRLMLIDWGCATRHGTKTLYAGSRAYAAHRLYDKELTDTATEYHVNLVDDYGSLLLTAASVFFMPDGVVEACETFADIGKDVVDMTCSDWLQFWQRRLPQQWWHVYTLLSTGRYEDAHETVLQHLETYLPDQPMWS